LARKVAVIRGDGIGPEIMDATLRVLEELGAPLEYVFVEAGMEAWRRRGTPISEEDIEAIRGCEALLKGPVATPTTGEGYRSVNVTLRRELGLYANVRWFRSVPFSPFRNVDIVLFRENVEDLYSGVEFSPVPGVGVTLRIVTEMGSERLLEKAFRYAEENGRRLLTVVHKASIMRETCGLFVKTAERLAERHPKVRVEYMLVDAAAYNLVRDPARFDLIATTNMFGDILSDEIAGLVGSIGLCPSSNLGDSHAMFEAVHGAAFDIAGRGVANPIGLVLSAARMLEYLGLRREAWLLDDAVAKTLEHREWLTPDLGGLGTTRSVTERIIEFIRSAG